MFDDMSRLENHMVLGGGPDEPEPCNKCDQCGDDIYYGYDYYDLGDEILCEDCFEKLCDEWRRCDN